MKKLMFVLSFLMIFLICFVGSRIVEAADDWNQIYHISSFDVDTNSKFIVISGFAFIDHMDNYGGDTLSSYISMDNGSGTTYDVPVTYAGGEDELGYYYSRCVNKSNQCSEQHRLELISSKVKRDNCNKKTYDCVYHNVEFEVTIDLDEMYEKLGSKSNISFYIVTENNIPSRKIVKKTTLGVTENVCKVDGISSLCNETIDFSNGGSISLIDISNRVKLTANNALVKNMNTDNIKPSGYYYKHGEFYTLAPISYETVDKYQYGVSYRIGRYVVYAKDVGGTVVPGGSNDGLYGLYDTWVQTELGIKLSFSEMPEVEESEPTSSKCDYGYNEIKKSKKVECGEEKTFQACTENTISIEGSFKLSDELVDYLDGEPCVGDTGVSIDVVAEANILLHERGTFEFGGVANSVYAGKSFDFPSLLYENTIYWKFDRNEDDEIKYKLYTVDDDGDLISGASIEYGEWVEYDYIPESEECDVCRYPVLDENGNETDNFDYDDCNCRTVGGYTPEPTCDPNNTYELDINSTINVGSGSDTIKNYLRKAASKRVEDEIKDYDNYSEYVIEGSVVKSYDSNKPSSTLKSVSGDWDRTHGGSWNDYMLSEDTHYSSTYEFDLYNSCIKLIGSDIGKVEYKSGTCSSNYKKYGSNAYFVPLQFENGKNKFKINIVENDISFVEGIEWNLSGTCSIDVKNLLYNDKSKNTGTGDNLKLRYRSISLEDPFPKGIIPANWSSWIAIDKNKKRLQNTYDNGIAYSISLRNGNSNGYSLGIDNINSDSTLGDYNDFKMNQDGTSKFIYKNPYNQYFDINANNSFCGIGKFSSTCDKYGS